MARKDFAAMDSKKGSDVREALRGRYHDTRPRTARLDQLAENPRNPRYPGDDAHIGEIASTMKKRQQQAVSVIERQVYIDAYAAAYPDVDYDQIIPPKAEWIVLLGNRRLRGARKAGLAELDIEVRTDLRTVEDIEDAILVENGQREPLPPLLEGEMLKEAVARPGQSTRTVAARIGKSHMYVSQRISLTKLHPDLQELLRTEKLNIKVARDLAAIRDQQEQLVAWQQLNAPPTVGHAGAANGHTVDDTTPASQRKPMPAKSAPEPRPKPAPVPEPAQARSPSDGHEENDVPGPAAVNPVYSSASHDGLSADATPQMIPLGSIDEIADALRAYLEPGQLTELIKVLSAGG